MSSVEPFSRSRWTGGCAIALIAGLVLNGVAISIGLKINVTVVATILGVLPGVALLIASRRVPRRDFGLGMLVGACIVAILGGACAAVFTATQVK